MTKIATIIPNWNLKADTIRCISALKKSTYSCRIIVVDNGSDDGSVQAIKRHFPAIEVIALAENLGFGQACNIGIREALTDPAIEFVFLLNNDAIIHSEALGTFLQYANDHPEIGIFGPKIYDDQRDGKIWYAGARRRRGVLAAAGTGRGQLDRGQFEQARSVDYVFGAAMLIRRQVIERIGLFDKRFFLYLEDLDFCLRTQSAGYELFFIPRARVWHTGSASTINNIPMRRYHYVRSTILFLKKHSAHLSMLPAALFWSLVFLKMVARDVFRGNVALLQSYWPAIRSGLTISRPRSENRSREPVV